MSLSTGTRLGPYEILSTLGAGGMGEVYKARDTRLDRTVAIKILPETLASDPHFRERFDREARAISQLTHPNICALYDVGEHDGTAFLVMELLDGETLADRLTKGSLAPAQALTVAIEIASALDAAHRGGIVHRDLKPGNVILTKAGAKLLDFGLAKTNASVAGVSGTMVPTTPPNITAQGMILGTFQYMAPEQIEGVEADARTDIFAFGCVLFEMLTGQKAFEGRTRASLIGAILKDEPPPVSRVQPVASASLDRIVATCLAKDPDDRWQSARDVMRELQWIAGGGQAVPSTGRGIDRRALIGVGMIGAVAGAALAAAIAWPITRRGEPFSRDVTRTLVGVAPADSLRSLALDQTMGEGRPSRTAFALSPDGRSLVFSAVADGRQQLFVRALDQLEATPLAGTEDGQSPFLSPDGRWVGFQARNVLRKVPLAGGVPPTTICEVPPLFGASWGKNDTIVYGTMAAGLWRVSSGGGTPQPLTVVDAKKGEYSHRLPHFLPDGQTLIFTMIGASQPKWDDARLSLLTVSTGEWRDLGPGADARYVSSGHLLFMRSGTLVAAPFDVTKREIAGNALTLLGDVMQAANMMNQGVDTGAGQFSVSESGTLVYMPGGIFPDREMTIVSVDRRGNTQVLPVATRAYLAPLLSPDGTRLVVWTQGLDRNVWMYEIARGTLTRLTTEGRNHRGIWTPDGKRITYAGAVTGGDNLFWTPADGSGSPERLTTAPYYQSPSSWSPDGRTLAFFEQRGSTNEMMALSLDGDRPSRPLIPSRSAITYAEFSPDGRWLAYVSSESGRSEVYVQAYPGPGSRTQISTDGGVAPAWARSRHELFYTTLGSTGRTRILAVPITLAPSFTAGTPQMLFEGSYNTQSVTRGYDVSSDGQRFYFTQVKERPPIRATQMILVQNWIEDLQRRVPTK